MKDDIHILDDSLAIMGVAHISGEHFYIIQAINILQPSPVVEGIVVAQGFDFCATLHEHFSQMRADEAVSAGDEDFFH